MTQQTVPQTGLGAASSAFAPVDRSNEANTQAAQAVEKLVDVGIQVEHAISKKSALGQSLGDTNEADEANIFNEEGGFDPKLLDLTKIQAGISQGKITRGVQARSLAQVAVKESISRNPRFANEIRQQAAQFFSQWNPGEGAFMQAKADTTAADIAKKQGEIQDDIYKAKGKFLAETSTDGNPWVAWGLDPTKREIIDAQIEAVKPITKAIELTDANAKLGRSGKTMTPNQQVNSVSDWSMAATALQDSQYVAGLSDIGIEIPVGENGVDFEALVNLTDADQRKALGLLEKQEAVRRAGFSSMYPNLAYEDSNAGIASRNKYLTSILTNKLQASQAAQRLQYATKQWSVGVIKDNPEALTLHTMVNEFGFRIEKSSVFAFSGGVQNKFTQSMKDMLDGKGSTASDYVDMYNKGNTRPGANKDDGTPVKATNAYQEVVKAQKAIMTEEITPENEELVFNSVSSLLKTLDDPDLPAHMVGTMFDVLTVADSKTYEAWKQANPTQAVRADRVLADAAVNYLAKATARAETVLGNTPVSQPILSVDINKDGLIQISTAEGVSPELQNKAANIHDELTRTGVLRTMTGFARLAGVDDASRLFAQQFSNNNVFKISPAIASSLEPAAVVTPTKGIEDFDLDSELPTGGTMRDRVDDLRAFGMSDEDIVSVMSKLKVR